MWVSIQCGWQVHWCWAYSHTWVYLLAPNVTSNISKITAWLGMHQPLFFTLVPLLLSTNQGSYTTKQPLANDTLFGWTTFWMNPYIRGTTLCRISTIPSEDPEYETFGAYVLGATWGNWHWKRMVRTNK
jgi:hypothetical protein